MLADAGGRSWDVALVARQVGAQLAELAGASDALVVAGAAAGLALGVAACAVRDAPDVAAALPVPGRFTVVAQATLRNSYDRMARLCGARIVSVGYPTNPGLGQTLPWELDAAIDDDTVAVLHTVTADPAALPLPVVAEIASRRGVPVVVDAAAALPPAENLRRFIAEGADLVVFSGGKAIRGPQASGLLLGCADLIGSARLQLLDMDVDRVLWLQDYAAEPWQHGLGRAMKVGPETMLALLAAVREFLMTDHDQIADEMTSWLAAVRATLGSGDLIGPSTAQGFYPSLVWRLDPSRARSLWRELASYDPSIRLAHSELASGLIRLRPEALSAGDRELIEEVLPAKLLLAEGAADF